MRHSSILLNEPVEFINSTEVNPLISKVQIKVCYVGDEPNRNGSIITKETARKIAPTLRGCPIVGFYNEEKGDFEEHNRIVEVKNGEWKIKDTTRPYGFVDLSARLWFQKFLDDGRAEKTYLMTEGYLWTEQYPEAQRVLTQGNGQSMELDEKSLRGQWTEDSPSFFIINDAILSKLCLLGDDVEPCFEGASVEEPRIQFSFDSDFKVKLFSMMTELKELLGKGGEQVELEKDVELIEDTEEEAVEAEVEAEEAAEAETEAEAEQVEEESSEAEPEAEPEAAPQYTLDQIPEYVQLMNTYNALETSFNELKAEAEAAKAELETLREFKQKIERKEKEAKIQEFFMLSDEDKADVVNNIDKYSLDEIEAKLSVVCFRNKISFSSEATKHEEAALSYNLDVTPQDSVDVPDWIKAVRETQNSME